MKNTTQNKNHNIRMNSKNNDKRNSIAISSKELAGVRSRHHRPRPRLTWRWDAFLLCATLCVTMRPHHRTTTPFLNTNPLPMNQTTLFLDVAITETAATTTTTTTTNMIIPTNQELYESQHALNDYEWEWMLVRIHQVTNLPMESMGMDFPDPQISVTVDAELPQNIAFSGPLTEFHWPTKWNVPTNYSEWEGVGIVSYLRDTATSYQMTITEQNQIDQNYQLLQQSQQSLPPLEEWTNVTFQEHGILMDVSILRSRQPLFQDRDHVDMQLTEHLLLLENGELASLAHRTHPSHRKAVLYFAGRSDSLAHPHLVDLYFKKKGYDVYALDPRRSGRARRFLKNIYLGSDIDDFSLLHEDLSRALDFMRQHKATQHGAKYDQVVAHCHSNGALILLSYMLERQQRQIEAKQQHDDEDETNNYSTTSISRTITEFHNEKDDFDGYILNSPFLDWGHVGGSFNKFILKNAHVLAMASSSTGASMELYAHYNTLNDWWTKIWLLYRWNLSWKPIITNSMTLHYARAVSDLQYRLQQYAAAETNSKLLNQQPTLILSSRSDDILKHLETMKLAGTLHSHPTVHEFQWHSHDVTKSFTKELNDEANTVIGNWLDDLQVYHSVS